MTDTLDSTENRQERPTGGMSRPTSGANPRRRARFGVMRFSGIYLWIALIVTFGILVPQTFLTQQTAVGILGTEAVTVIIAVGLLFSLSAGGFDLSIGQNLGFSAVVVATLSTEGGLDPWTSVAVGIVLSTLVGVVNGYFVSVVKINSLIATLAMTSVLLGATRLVSGQRFRGPVPEALREMSNASVFGVPVIVVYALIFALIGWYLLEHTPFGRRIYATGANPDSAYLAGVATQRYLFLSFVITGAAAGIAGALLAGKIGSVGPDIGPAYLLPAFAACFLGTTQLKPGKFNVWGTVVAILLLATGVKGLQLMGGAQWVTDVFNGVALLAAVSLAVVSARRTAAGRASRQRSLRSGA